MSASGTVAPLLRGLLVTFFLSLIILILTLPLAQAAPTVTCHCFEERAFDATQPAAADPYFLASAQNSLFAALSSREKKQVVRAKMSGALAADLWVNWKVAAATGVTDAAVATLRQEGLAWPAVAARLKVRPGQFDKAFAGVLEKQGTTAELAAAVVDAVLAGRCGANPAEIKMLRLAGADDQQTILAVFLGRKTGRRADELHAVVKAGGETWGSLLNDVGVNDENLESEIRRMVH